MVEVVDEQQDELVQGLDDEQEWGQPCDALAQVWDGQLVLANDVVARWASYGA